MNAAQIVGGAMIVGLFVGLFVLAATLMDWKAALFGYAIMAGLVAYVLVATQLMTGDIW